MFKWAGHVSRIAQYDKERLTNRMLQHKSWSEIQRIAQANSGNQLHCRKLKVWRWEAPLYKFWTEEPWQNAARDKSFWNSQLDVMICTRCRARWADFSKFSFSSFHFVVILVYIGSRLVQVTWCLSNRTEQFRMVSLISPRQTPRHYSRSGSQILSRAILKP